MIYTKNEIQRRVNPVLARYGVNMAWLFGSYARGDAKEQSDVDILIDGGAIRTLFQLSALRLELEDALQKSVDLISIGCNDESFLQTIRKDEVKLYDAA